MERRYHLFAENNVRDIKSFNKLAATDPMLEKMPYIAIIIDELADLMMVVGKDVEDSICRIAQKARAAGMHLIVATQRPSVDVITGLIKANIPSRIAFAVSSQVDSRTILDGAGAEKLLGQGDMLLCLWERLSRCVSRAPLCGMREISRVLDFIKQSATVQYDEAMIEAMESTPFRMARRAHPLQMRMRRPAATRCSSRPLRWSLMPGRHPPACCSAAVSWVMPAPPASWMRWSRRASSAPMRVPNPAQFSSAASSGWKCR